MPMGGDPKDPMKDPMKDPNAEKRAKELVNLAYQGPLTDGVAIERRYFHALFGTDDQREGMDAFINKRKAGFKNQ